MRPVKNYTNDRTYSAPCYDDGLQVIQESHESEKQVTPQEQLTGGSYVQISVRKDDKEVQDPKPADDSLPIPLESSPARKYGKGWTRQRWICAIIVFLAIALGAIAAGVSVSLVNRSKQSQRLGTFSSSEDHFIHTFIVVYHLQPLRHLRLQHLLPRRLPQ